MADDEPRVAEDAPEEGAPEWMVTFGDLMSLLLTFFVLLLSFSQMDAAKFKELAGSLERAFGVQRVEPAYQPPMGMTMVARDFDQAIVEQAKVDDSEVERIEERDLVERLREVIGPLEAQGLVELEPQEEYLVLRLLGHATFDSGKTEIKSEMLPTLRAVGDIVGRSMRDVFVAGHTDNVPIRGGKFRSNLELSVARAASVVDFFLTERLVRADKIATMGFGEYRPVVPNDSESNREKNRRVELILTSTKTTTREAESFPFSTRNLISPK
jgi:chemotaxis protein MotB